MNFKATSRDEKHSGSNQDYEETFIGPAATFERKGHTGLGRFLLLCGALTRFLSQQKLMLC